MAERIGETCDHYRHHKRLDKSIEDNVAVETFICEECCQEWRYERGLTIAEESERLNEEIKKLWDEILRAFEQ